MDTTGRQGLEALLFLAEEPVDVRTLAEVLEVDEDDVEGALLDLAAAYEREERGLTIRRAAGGWRMYTAEAAHPAVERYVLAGRSGRLTQAALETLAVVAYKQPISRQQISDIRGVNADGAVRSLVARGYVEEVARDEGPGQAILYGTTTLLLERLGLDDLSQLPPLTEFLPEEPAPDEPELDQLRQARKHLATGEDLPATGRGRWSALDDAAGTGPDDEPDARPGDRDAALPPVEAAASRRGQDEEMDELTVALERAARSAMAQLRDAVAATEDAEDRDDVEDPEDVGEDADGSGDREEPGAERAEHDGGAS